MLKKKLVVLNTTLLLGLGSSLTIPAIHANATQQSSISQQKSDLQSQITDAQVKIAEAQKKVEKLDAQIKRVNKAIEENQILIDETQVKMKETEEEIASLQKAITELEDRIEKRNNILKERARTFQENGGSVDYIEVLFGAESFKDFVDRVGAVATIMEADQDLIASNEKDKKEVEAKKADVETNYTKLKDMKLDLEEMQKQNVGQQESNEQAKKDLENEEASFKAEKAELEQKYGALNTQEASVQQIVQQRETDSLNNLVATSVGSSSESKATGGKATAISAGYKYIGNSTYKFGGGRTASDVANGLFDCSGFVSWAYSQAGYSIPASTDGLKNTGSQVSINNIQPGDLVFFNTYKTDGHVGIYIGNGKFIGSQSSTGVAIASMDSGYWKSTFNGRVVRL
ncbi:coiled-coil domain-containing protein [Bacillus sp. B1-b2]|uniref:coiled-coil domain-containing protein n=1 Tax=Bacillus sp. B1-b2 TaxID=2653201 RepID=UPI0012628174|nr:C40 family peptidase [Bacillus sp. B1-b2]KAB7669387.1 peptidase [Bacillus sp. B1-b2]